METGPPWVKQVASPELGSMIAMLESDEIQRVG
jgi:hypothetical protein